MKIIEPGHIYNLDHLCSSGSERLTFIKRSGGAIQYEEEHPGTNTQEVIRALIERTEYLDDVLECIESKDVAWHLRMTLYLYEVRAFRRKVEKLNREANAHDDGARPRPDRSYPDAVPFNEQDIEKRPVGHDGHIRIPQEILKEYFVEYHDMTDTQANEFANKLSDIN